MIRDRKWLVWLRKIEILFWIFWLWQNLQQYWFVFAVSRGMWVGSVHERENEGFRNIYFACPASKSSRFRPNEPRSDFSAWCRLTSQTVGPRTGTSQTTKSPPKPLLQRCLSQRDQWALRMSERRRNIKVPTWLLFKYPTVVDNDFWSPGGKKKKVLSGTELAEAKGQIPQGEISAWVCNKSLKLQEKTETG